MKPENLLQNRPVDVRSEFADQRNHFYVPDRLVEFDRERWEGRVSWRPVAMKQRVSYHQLTVQLEGYQVWQDVPPHEYEEAPSFPLRVSFASPRAVRLRLASRPAALEELSSPILESCPEDDSWEPFDDGRAVTWRSPHGSLTVERKPWRVVLRDAADRVLTATRHVEDSASVVNVNPMPFSFVRRALDLHRHLAVSLSLSPGERLYGGGESFTRLDKRGQTLHLWTCDAYGSESDLMYKPVPFLLSSRGYALFLHTSAPVSWDLGEGHDSASVAYLGEDVLDLFLFLGGPREVVSEYTALTGRAAEPPLWSFGLWLGRESYRSQGEVEGVAAAVRERDIPCDVLHIDTDWTEVPFQVDFRFSPSRFPDPDGMLERLRERGLRLMVWVQPYFHPTDPLHTELIDRGYAVLAANGEPPVDDAVLDLSNPDAVRWYQERLEGVLRQGVACFTADFGEAAPISGIYAGELASHREHNLYPLRYNRAVVEATERVTGERVQWARSAWAGSQRYPVHWGGDAEVEDTGFAGTLRGGLSLGVSGFSFWGHFVGGFPKPTPPGLYGRWLAFGALSSHMRCHGAPPTEPWELGEEFEDLFRRITRFRYSLLPYLWAQAGQAAAAGHPMLRPLFFEYPADPGSWLVDDAYMLGTDLLVAPLLEEAAERHVYLPPGRWVGFFDGAVEEGPGFRRLATSELPVVLLAREGAAVPRIAVARCVDEADWSTLELAVAGGDEGEALVRLPDHRQGRRVRVRGGAVAEDPFGGRVDWKVSALGEN